MKITDMPGRHNIAASVLCNDKQLKLVEFATNTIKKAGFEFVSNSMKSEACYYRLGDRQGLLRIAALRFGGRNEGYLLSLPVWSCLTFAEPKIKSPVRKAASALITKIPFALSTHIARVFRP